MDTPNKPVFQLWLLLPLVAVLFASCSNSVTTKDFGVYTCDAETVDDKRFQGVPIQFDKSETQSDEKARSGKFSSRVDSTHAFGMGMRIANLKAGAWLDASVWRKGGVGSLVIADTSGQTYETTSFVEYIDDQDWELLRLKLKVTEEMAGKLVYIYVNAERGTTSWFDDMRVVYSERNQEYHPLASAPSTLSITIPDESMQKLQAMRDTAVNNYIISENEKKYVMGFVIIDGEQVPIKLRLKGDWTDHLTTDKWSFRIKIDGDASWKQMRTFNIQSPHTRAFLWEWIAHKLCEQEDLLTTRYGFVNVKINGKEVGIYAYEEHFEKQLVEWRKRREGPILKMDETGFWALNLIQHRTGKFLKVPFYEAATVTPFKSGKTMKNPSLRAQFVIAQTLVNQFKNGKGVPGQMLDVNQWAKYYALLDLAAIAHAQTWHNKRFYYNPVTCKLEPIVYDCYSPHLVASSARPSIWIYDEVYPRQLPSLEQYTDFHLFQDSAFLAAYLAQLEHYSSDEFVSAFYETIQQEMTDHKVWLYKEHPNIAQNDSFLFFNAKRIREDVQQVKQARDAQQLAWTYQKKEWYDDPEQPIQGINLTIFTTDTAGGNFQYEVSNFHTEPLYIIGYGNNKATMQRLSTPVKVPGADAKNPYAKTAFSLPQFSKKVYYATSATGTDLKKARILPWPAPGATTPEQQWFNDLTVSSNALFEVEGKNITFRKGNHSTSENILIPQGYTVTIPAGTSMDFTQGAAFVCKSTIHLNGTAEEPIVIRSSDASMHGFTILQAPAPSSASHVQFKGLNTLINNGWVLTGAVTFYESEVQITNCSFEQNVCEDALNIIRTNFSLVDSRFDQTFGDALDVDFGVGNITNCQFDAVGNDAIDVSGSDILVENCAVNQPGDKGVSGGEDSRVKVEGTTIVGGAIGVAAKDLSRVEVNNSTVTDCEFGFTAFRKKPEFGPAHFVLSNVTISGAKHRTVVETRSFLVENGDTIYGGENVEVYGWYQ